MYSLYIAETEVELVPIKHLIFALYWIIEQERKLSKVWLIFQSIICFILSVYVKFSKFTKFTGKVGNFTVTLPPIQVYR